MSSSKPNVIVVLCDQLRAFEIGCYGSTVVSTPNMDRLAANGVRFEIACSNNPVCTPGRSILLSGQYGRTCMGHLGNVHEPIPERVQLRDTTIAEAFKSAGYDTALLGKWHIGPLPSTIGFDFSVYPKVAHRYTHQTYIDETGEPLIFHDYSANYEAQVLDRYIADHTEKPFFLYYNISQPHMPLGDAPEKYREMYPRDAVQLRKNVFNDGAMSYDEFWFRIYLWDYLFYVKHLPYTEESLGDFDLVDLTRLYYGMVTWADDQLGNLIRCLERNGIAENTIVVFTSDHGDNLGSHGAFNKDLLYDEANRIPIIYQWPSQLQASRTTNQVASLVDIMPTTLGLAGIPIPPAVQGTDLSSVVRGEAETVGENCAFIENSPGHIGIRTPTHLYGVQKRKGQGRTWEITDPDFQFFDTMADPFELDNLAKSPNRPPIGDELRAKVVRWDNDTKWLGSQE